MAEKKGFDLGAALAAVSNSGTQADRAQIVRYDIDAIYPDPGNFYSMSGIEELMASIELVGLQQPLLVRQHPEKPAAVMIVSGHRRREAIKRLVDEGREDLRTVPCLLEAPAASAELQELKLIYANSDTRHLSSAEISAQAARVEELLYKLKEQGYEFPGRMRDHVAEACKVSQTKLARLKVIRDHLIKPWASRWKKNDLSEATAYRLAQCDKTRQALYYSVFGAKSYVYDSSINTYEKKLDAIEKCKCKNPKGVPCINMDNKRDVALHRSIFETNYCANCCAECPDLWHCKRACSSLKSKVDKLKADEKARKKHEQELREQAEAPKIAAVAEIWRRWDDARAKAGKTIAKTFKAAGVYYMKSTDEDIRKTLSGETKLRPDSNLPFGWASLSTLEPLIKTADFLGVTTDYLLGRSDNMQPTPAADRSAAPEGFRSGETPPAEKTLAWCAFIVDGHELTTAAVWWPHLGKWCFEQGAGIDAECVGWIPLPDWKGVLRDEKGDKA